MDNNSSVFKELLVEKGIRLQYHLRSITQPIIFFIPGDIFGNELIRPFLDEATSKLNIISVDYQHVKWKNNLEAAKAISDGFHRVVEVLKIRHQAIHFVAYSSGAHLFLLMLQRKWIASEYSNILIAPLIKLKDLKSKPKLKLVFDILWKSLFKRQIKISFSNFDDRFLRKTGWPMTQKRQTYAKSLPLNVNLILDKELPDFNQLANPFYHIIHYWEDAVISSDYIDDCLKIWKTKYAHLF